MMNLTRSLVVSASLMVPVAAHAVDDPTARVESKLVERMPTTDYITIMGLADTIVKESAKIGVEPEVVLGVIHVESRFRPRAKSPKGCQGMMQLEPTTMIWYVKTFGDDWPDPQIYDPIDNVRIATRYLGYLLHMFKGNLRHALMAYNAGPGKLLEWLKRGHVPRQVQDYQVLVIRASESFKPVEAVAVRN